MRKVTSISLVALFALSVVIGATLSTVEAKPPTPATYKCFNHDTYFCTLHTFLGHVYEVCEFEEYGCDFSSSWYCTTIGEFEYACPTGGSMEDCVWHPISCP